MYEWVKYQNSKLIAAFRFRPMHDNCYFYKNYIDLFSISQVLTGSSFPQLQCFPDYSISALPNLMTFIASHPTNVFSKFFFFLRSKILSFHSFQTQQYDSQLDLKKKKKVQKCPDFESLKDKTGPIFIISKIPQTHDIPDLIDDLWMLSGWQCSTLCYSNSCLTTTSTSYLVFDLSSTNFTQHFQVYNWNCFSLTQDFVY